MRDRTLVNLGAAIRRAREAADISQEELAHRAELHRTYIGSVERGERNVGVKNIVAIARALAVPVTQLLRDLDSPKTRGRQ